MDFNNWQNKGDPNQGGNSRSNFSQFGQNQSLGVQNVTYPRSYYGYDRNVNNPQNSYSYNTPASNTYNCNAGSDSSRGAGYSQGNSYNSQPRSHNAGQRSYNSASGTHSYNYDDNRSYKSSNRNQGNSFRQQNSRDYARPYEVNQFHNDPQRSYDSAGPRANKSWQSYGSSRSYDNTHLGNQNPNTNTKKYMGKKPKYVKPGGMMRLEIKNQKAKKELRRQRHEKKTLKNILRAQDPIIITKKSIFAEIRLNTKMLDAKGNYRLVLKALQVVENRLKMINGDNKDPQCEHLLKEYRDKYPASLDEKFIQAVLNRMTRKVAEDEATVLTEEDILFIENPPNRSKKQEEKNLLTETVAQVNVENEVATKLLTVDDIDNAISVRTEQILQLMLQVNDFYPRDNVEEFVQMKLQSGGAALIKNQLTRMISKALIRPDADKEQLMLRILGHPKIPPQIYLEEYLAPYTIRDLKKSYKDKHMAVIRVKSREDYEALLKNENVIIAGHPVVIKQCDKLEVKIDKYLRKNKTWIKTVSKETQELAGRMRKRTAQSLRDKQKFQNRKPSRRDQEDDALYTQAQKENSQGNAEDQNGSEGQGDVDNLKDMNEEKDSWGDIEGQEDIASQQEIGAQGDIDSQVDIGGQDDFESQGDIGGQDDFESQGDMGGQGDFESQGHMGGQGDFESQGDIGQGEFENQGDIGGH